VVSTNQMGIFHETEGVEFSKLRLIQPNEYLNKPHIYDLLMVT
jgi:hypothetical protein